MEKWEWFPSEFKVPVALEAIRGELTIAQVVAEHGVCQTVIHAQKRQAVELRLCKMRRRLAQDRFGMAKLADFPLQSLDPLPFFAGWPGSNTQIALGLRNRDAPLLDQPYRLDLEHARELPALHPNPPVLGQPYLGVHGTGSRPRRLRHGSNLSRVGASGKPGAIH